MRKLLIYMKDYRKESVCAPLFKLLEAAFELLVPLVMARIIDIGIKNQDTAYILRMRLLMVALGAIVLICSVTAQYFSAKAAVGFSAKLREALFAHIQALSFTEMDDIGTSTLITRMTSDINQVQSGVNLFLRLFLRSPFIVFGAMIMAFTIDVKAAMVFVVVIPILCVIVFGIMLLSIPMYRRVQERLDKVVRVTRENLLGVRVIRAFCREKQEIEGFDADNEALVKVQLLSGRISALMNPMTYVVINFGLIALLYTGARRVDMGIITQGSVVALVNYMSQILVELVKLANLIITVTKAIACGNRIQTVLDVPVGMEAPEKDAGSEHPGNASHRADDEERPENFSHRADGAEQLEKVPAVVFDHVSLQYRGAAADTLTDLSFTANRGETIGIIGGTGSGKTSLVSLIPRFYDVREGCVRVDGRDVREYPLDELRQKVGIVMQKPVLFKGTIRSNLLWGNEGASDEELLEAVRAAQAVDVLTAHSGRQSNASGVKPNISADKTRTKNSSGNPSGRTDNASVRTDEETALLEGLDAPVEQEGRNFSGGQKQRLTIARALVRHPEILILDDSASALDFATDARLRRALRELSADRSKMEGRFAHEDSLREGRSFGNAPSQSSSAGRFAHGDSLREGRTCEMTVFIVSQRTSSIAHADRIIVLEDGRVAGIGTHEELLAGCEVYRETYHSQFPEKSGSEQGKEALA
ncbi:MAG: ABC transporter ATP-binding protein/permease [Lachnospiraceae bacterium]|nr:ABC transporter ATP-binding protein/permease [Lachnospiraceae bacterium]